MAKSNSGLPPKTKGKSTKKRAKLPQQLAPPPANLPDRLGIESERGSLNTAYVLEDRRIDARERFEAKGKEKPVPRDMDDAWLALELPRTDSQERFKAETQKHPVTKEMQNTFLRSKLHMLQTYPVPPPQRERLVESFANQLSLTAPLDHSDPPPGGVGYGTYYNPYFKTAFQFGTALAWGIVFATPPGGNVDTFLYLTGMNRASVGAEAYIAYNGQDDIRFAVWDWSKPASQQPVVNCDLSAMTEYVGTIPVNGNQLPLIQLMNLTYQNGGESWTNEVQVLNQTTHVPTVAYQSSYPATIDQQKGSAIGSWAAIVETFQPFYQNTNPMGCFQAKIASMNAPGTWGPWGLLDPSEVSFRTDNKGFHPLLPPTDYNWLVIS